MVACVIVSYHMHVALIAIPRTSLIAGFQSSLVHEVVAI